MGDLSSVGSLDEEDGTGGPGSGGFAAGNTTWVSPNGNTVKVNYLVNLKSGLCPEDCFYCSQRLNSTAGILRYTWLNTEEAVTAAKKHGTIVSYDLNYRPSLWKDIGGQAKAQEVNKEIATSIDVMIGNEEDFTASLGFEVEGVDENLADLEVDSFAAMIERAAATYPNFQVIGNTMRTVHSASDNDWGALAWSRETGVVQATHRTGVEILDRVGGGDSFASGLIYGLLEGEPLQTAVQYGAAHGALAMTTPGDTSMVTKDEVLKLAGGGSARVDR